MDVYQRLRDCGYSIPEAPKPVASYLPAKQHNDVVYSSGQTGTINGELTFRGKVANDVSIPDAQQSAKVAVLNCLAAIEITIGDLNRIAEIVRLTGYVASSSGFSLQPQVVEGASRLLLDVFGDKGQHARSAIGVAELPSNAPVEVELIVRVA